MNTKAILLAAILGVGAVAALVPTAAAEDPICHDAGDAAEVCYARHLETCGFVASVRVLSHGEQIYWC